VKSDHDKHPDTMLIFAGGLFGIAVVLILIYLGLRSPIEDEIVRLLTADSSTTYIVDKLLDAPLLALSLLFLTTGGLLFLVIRRPDLIKLGRKKGRQRKLPRRKL